MPKVSADRLLARRRQILDGARASFARHGYEGATVRVLEEEIGLSRGAIFHHYPDKEALFMALAAEDAQATLDTVAEHGLVQVMRDMVAAPDAGRLGTQLEIARRLRTDAAFRQAWAPRLAELGIAVRSRLRRQRDAGLLRADVDIDVVAAYLELTMEGLIAHLAAQGSTDQLRPVLDLVVAIGPRRPGRGDDRAWIRLRALSRSAAPPSHRPRPAGFPSSTPRAGWRGRRSTARPRRR
jgi:AcrR family transcriptional regulator